MSPRIQQQLLPGERVVGATRLHWGIYLPGIVFAPVLVGFLFLLLAWVKRKTTELVVTDRRVLLQTGLLSRELDELRLDKLESCQAKTFLGFPWGRLRFVGSGGTSREIHNVENPLAFRALVMQTAGSEPLELLRAG